MPKEIDARGLSCPQPVVLVKNAIDVGEQDMLVIANDPAARDNVRRLVQTFGYTVDVVEEDSEFRLTITKQD